MGYCASYTYQRVDRQQEQDPKTMVPLFCADKTTIPEDSSPHPSTQYPNYHVN
ncbi:hypothetical protein EXN66_Car002385 [Channa argus]|uniref:Uncharacterized protein n=1 Tax=Channa argus TaxID=215402 RepID=A0A6G1P939_CHAAH|nr:hypothetical protein EXN66_Car002385 [Channa argus]